MIRSLVLCFAVSLFSTSYAAAQEPASPPPLPQLVPAPSGDGVRLVRAKESFSSLSLKGSDLNPAPPLSAGKIETAIFSRELLQLQWRPNDPIDVYVIRPRGIKKPPVALYLYGFPTDTDRFKDNRFCERITRGGVAAIGFVSALTGHRNEHRPPKEWFVSELPEALATSVHDVQMILNYLASRDDLDIDRAAIFGQGSGGAIAILSAAADARLKTVDLLDPWGDWPHWLAKAAIVPQSEREQYLKTSFLQQLEPLEPVRFLPELKSRKVRIQFVDEYAEPPKEAAHRIEEVAPPTATVLHFPTSMQFRNTVADGGLFVWIASQLNPPSQRPAPVDSKPSTQSAGATAMAAH